MDMRVFSFRAVDIDTMFEVAWHELPLAPDTDLSNLSETPSLEHKHLLKVLAKWEENTGEERHLVVITEIVDAGTLESHTARIKHDVRAKVVKKWCRQILDGLRHLHEETGRVSLGLSPSANAWCWLPGHSTAQPIQYCDVWLISMVISNNDR